MQAPAIKDDPNILNSLYRDTVIVRYRRLAEYEPDAEKKNDVLVDRIEVKTDNAFMEFFRAPKSDPQWKTINYVQTCVKAKKGFGKLIIVDFFAPMDMLQLQEDVRFNYKALGEDIELLETNEYAFCVKQCYKMCYYVQKLYQMDVLKMKCEFLKDDNDSIWFSHAQDIVTRNTIGRELELKQTSIRQAINLDHQNQLLHQLEEYRQK